MLKGYNQSQVERLERVAAGLPAEKPWDDQLELGAFGGVADIPPRLYEQQQWWGKLNEPSATPRPLLRLNLPVRYARDWTIQLATPSVPSGAAVGMPSTIAGVATLRWGHHGAFDQVDFMWPERGGSLTVHGNFLELLLRDPGSPAGTEVAEYSVWMTEGAGARQSPYAFQPMFCENVGTIAAASATGFIPFAARARAFYLSMLPQIGAGAIVVRLFDNLVQRVEVQLAIASANVNGLYDMMRAPILIPPWVNGLQIENQAADVLDAVVVNQFLDLGG